MPEVLERPKVSNEEKLNQRLEEVVINTNYYRQLLMSVAASPTTDRIANLAAIMVIDNERNQKILNEVR